MMEQDNVNASVVWLSGAAQGIGRSVAGHLAAQGHTIWLSDINEEAVSRAADEIQQTGGRAVGFRCDVTDETDVKRAAQRIVDGAGRIDVLINSAGLVHVDPILELPYATWKRVMAVNTDGTMLAGTAAARQMIKQEEHSSSGRRGMILNVGSPVAEWGRPRFAAYGASKAAVKHWTMSLAEAMIPEQIAVTLLYPGMVLDGMYKTIIAQEAALDGTNPEELAAARASGAPSGRYQEPEELGPFVQHLISTPGMSAAGQVVWTAPYMRSIQ